MGVVISVILITFFTSTAYTSQLCPCVISEFSDTVANALLMGVVISVRGSVRVWVRAGREGSREGRVRKWRG